MVSILSLSLSFNHRVPSGAAIACMGSVIAPPLERAILVTSSVALRFILSPYAQAEKQRPHSASASATVGVGMTNRRLRHSGGR